jgi:GNAT superfamily N-acetyltransferase
MTAAGSSQSVLVRPARQEDLAEVDRIFRMAFGTFLGLEDPTTFSGARQLARHRWLVEPDAVLVAEMDGRLAGSNFAANWGSVGWFGPLSIRPDLWNGGIAQRLLDATMQVFERWGTRHAGLYTFAQSTKHLHLYQRYGFWPRFLTAAMARDVDPSQPETEYTSFSDLSEPDRSAALRSCAELSGSIYEGLELQREIESVAGQHLGETLLIHDDSRLESFAVCHFGPDSEADTGNCYAKFAAVRPGVGAAGFDRLLQAWNSLARGHGLNHLYAGVNTARHEAYRQLLARGFRTLMQGVTMHRPNEPGYDRPDVYLLDDWR